MTSALKELLGQLSTNAKKAPGWLPLLLLGYATASLIPEEAAIFGLSIAAHRELVVSGTTLILYMLGDAIDKPVFKRAEPSWLSAYRDQAKVSLAVESGIYRVSKALAVAAKKYDGTWIQVKNELAKLLRSLVIPSLGIGVAMLFRDQYLMGASGLAASIVFLLLYVRLKARHMADLYALSQTLVRSTEYYAHNLSSKVRLFFWDGEQVSSAPRPESAAATHVG